MSNRATLDLFPHIPVASNASLTRLTAMPDVLARVVADRLRTWFLDDAGRDRTFREVRRFDEPRVDLDEVADRVQDLTDGAGP